LDTREYSAGRRAGICFVSVTHIRSSNITTRKKEKGEKTHARESVAAVTALGLSRTLLEVKVAKLSTRSLDHSSAVRAGVVAIVPSIMSLSPQVVYIIDRKTETHGLVRLRRVTRSTILDGLKDQHTGAEKRERMDEECA
jgi:hypothetical protein